MISTDVECHIWAPPFQLTAHVTALHAPAFRGHRVCNPSLISHVTVPTLGLEPGVDAEHGDRCVAPRVRACSRRRAHFGLTLDAHGPIYTREYIIRAVFLLMRLT